MITNKQKIQHSGLLGVIIVTQLMTTSQMTMAVIADDFNDGVINSAWQIIEQSGNAYVVEEGGTLKFGGSSGVTEGITLQHTSEVGIDESVWIDYDWITCTQHKARWGIGIFDQWQNTGIYINLVPNNWGASEHWAGIYTYQDGVENIIYSTEPWPWDGRLQIIRNGDQLIPQYWNTVQNSWIEFGNTATQFNFHNSHTYVFMHSSNSNMNPTWEIAVDNFCVPEPATTSLLGLGSIIFLKKSKLLLKATTRWYSTT